MKASDLDNRERIGLAFGGVALLLVIVLAVYIPYGPKKQFEQTRAQVNALSERIALAKVDQEVLREQLHSEEALKIRIESRSQNFALFSYMNLVLKEQNLLNRALIENTRSTRRQADNEVMVDVRMEGVSLDELIKFLHTVYASENLVRMYKMQIRPMARNEGLVCDLTFMTVRV